MSSINYQTNMLEDNQDSEDCGVDEEEGLLSCRMDRLSLTALTVKSLESITHSPPAQAISAPLLNASRTIPPPPRPSVPVLKTSRREKSSAALSKSRSKRTSHPHSPLKKENYCLEDGKMFQLAEGGRFTMFAEVRNMRIREFSGRGLLVFPNGKKFEGEWVEGTLIGRAKITHANGDTYFGDTYEFRRHGRGTLVYSSGEKYQGEFSCGDFHGEGALYDAKGKVLYDGEWRRGKQYTK